MRLCETTLAVQSDVDSCSLQRSSSHVYNDLLPTSQWLRTQEERRILTRSAKQQQGKRTDKVLAAFSLSTTLHAFVITCTIARGVYLFRALVSVCFYFKYIAC